MKNQVICNLEQENLATYACHPEKSKGRLIKEAECSNRHAFRRDCDRIIHSTAFRRLEYKTQVFVNHEGDHFRTRLTHSLEVAQISRAICRNLKLHEDLGETLALAHDLGHPPFGHSGEDALHQSNKKFGGFDHNAQSIKILTNLEHKYVDFDGLNLTWETLEGIAKHNGPVIGKYRDKTRYANNVPNMILAHYNRQHDLELEGFASGEAQVAALADDIAYNNHDLDDGLRASLFNVEQVKELPFIGTIFCEVHQQYPTISEARLRNEAIRKMIHAMIEDVVVTTLDNIVANNIQTVDDIRSHHAPIVCFSKQMSEYNKAIKVFLKQHMYRHYRVARMNTKSKSLLKDLYDRFMMAPECLPISWQDKEIYENEKHRATRVIDFIAGMTDRFAVEEHAKLFDINVRT